MSEERRLRRLAATLVVACVVSTFAACGGDDEEVTLPSTTISTTGPTGATGATGASGADGATGSGAAVEEALTESGFGIQSVECPDDVPLESGDTFDCEFSGESGESGTLTITVESADDQSASISYLGEAGTTEVDGEGVDVEK